MEFESLHNIRFDDVDGAGIVYYPRFFHLCHKTFEDWFNAHGPVSYPQLICEEKKGFPTVGISGKFSAPLSYGDKASVKIWVSNIGNTSVTTSYKITRFKDQQHCFDAVITTVYLDLNSKKPEAIPREFREFFDKYKVSGMVYERF